MLAFLCSAVAKRGCGSGRRTLAVGQFCGLGVIRQLTGCGLQARSRSQSSGPNAARGDPQTSVNGGRSCSTISGPLSISYRLPGGPLGPARVVSRHMSVDIGLHPTVNAEPISQYDECGISSCFVDSHFLARVHIEDADRKATPPAVAMQTHSFQLRGTSRQETSQRTSSGNVQNYSRSAARKKVLVRLWDFRSETRLAQLSRRLGANPRASSIISQKASKVGGTTSIPR